MYPRVSYNRKCEQRSMKHHMVQAQTTILRNAVDTYFNSNPIETNGTAPTLTITIRDDVVKCISHKSTMVCNYKLETCTPVMPDWVDGLIDEIKKTCTCSFELNILNLLYFTKK